MHTTTHHWARNKRQQRGRMLKGVSAIPRVGYETPSLFPLSVVPHKPDLSVQVRHYQLSAPNPTAQPCPCLPPWESHLQLFLGKNISLLPALLSGQAASIFSVKVEGLLYSKHTWTPSGWLRAFAGVPFIFLYYENGPVKPCVPHTKWSQTVLCSCIYKEQLHLHPLILPVYFRFLTFNILSNLKQ